MEWIVAHPVYTSLIAVMGVFTVGMLWRVFRGSKRPLVKVDLVDRAEELRKLRRLHGR